MSNYSGGKKTKERIMLTARYLFFTNGFSNTTYTQIAEAANVNVGSIAYHFKSLSNLADTIYSEILAERAKVMRAKIKEAFPERIFSDASFAPAQYAINTQSYIDFPNYATFISERFTHAEIWDINATNATILELCKEYDAKISKTDLELEKYLYIPFSVFATRAVNMSGIKYTARDIYHYMLTQRLHSLHISQENIDKLLGEVDQIVANVRLNIDCYMHIS